LTLDDPLHSRKESTDDTTPVVTKMQERAEQFRKLRKSPINNIKTLNENASHKFIVKNKKQKP
jgi:hypothetical protein